MNRAEALLRKRLEESEHLNNMDREVLVEFANYIRDNDALPESPEELEQAFINWLLSEVGRCLH